MAPFWCPISYILAWRPKLNHDLDNQMGFPDVAEAGLSFCLWSVYVWLAGICMGEYRYWHLFC